jgi:hypothetical protein
MRSTTPQEFANCYGVFIADLVNVAYVLPQANTWLRTTLPDVESVYKLNVALFSAYKANVFLKRPPVKPRGRFSEMGTDREYARAASAYDKSVNLAWTLMTINLTSALTCAGVDPSEAAKILASFAKLKPRNINIK